MRGLSFLVLGFLLVSCGKSDSNHSSSQQQQQAPQEAPVCNSDEPSSACIGVDLLETMIDVPVSFQDGALTFLADKNVAAKGNRITCTTRVRNGESYRLNLNGNKLTVMTSMGSYDMDRLDEGTELTGSWAWNGYIDGGVYIIKTLTFVGTNRVIMKTNCEL
jgi:hypothetical protein